MTTIPDPIPAGVLVPEAASPIMASDRVAGGRVFQAAAVPLSDLLGGMNMRQLAGLHANPGHPLRERVQAKCSQCDTMLEVERMWATRVACDACCEAGREKLSSDGRESYWTRICPADSVFRLTSLTHAGFPRAQHEKTKTWAGDSSLFFGGPTGKGKTRLAMVLLRRAWFVYGKTVGTLWPEELKAFAYSHPTDRLERLKELAVPAVMLMDDSLLTGAQDEKIADFLKELLAKRGLLQGKHIIITSQIVGAEYEEQLIAYAKRNGREVSAADKARVGALLRRIRDVCGDPVSFADITPKDDEKPF